MRDVELLDALAQHAHALDEHAPAITTAEVELRAGRLQTPKSRRPLVSVAIAVAVVIAIVVTVAVVRGSGGSTRPPDGRAAPDALALSKYRWSTIPAPPYAGAPNAATVWTGHELIVWGGQITEPVSMRFNVGTAFDPRTGSWRVLPTGPLSPRRDSATVWTGHEMFIWGGAGAFAQDTVGDGAIYDPSTDAWRMVPASPLSPRFSAGAVWTGREVVVVGGTEGVGGDSNRTFTDAAAYDPKRDAWRKLPPMPTATGTPDRRDRTAVDRRPAARLAVLGRLLGRAQRPRTGRYRDRSGVVLAAHEPVASYPAGGERARHAVSPDLDRTRSARAAVVRLGSGAGLSRLGRWLPLRPRDEPLAPARPGSARPGTGRRRVDGRALVVVNTSTTFVDNTATIILGDGDAAAYDPVRDRWHRVARSPAAPQSSSGPLVWTGHEFLLPGSLGTIQNPSGVVAAGGDSAWDRES